MSIIKWTMISFSGPESDSVFVKEPFTKLKKYNNSYTFIPALLNDWVVLLKNMQAAVYMLIL